MCDVGDLDPCSVWRETPVVARKPGRCSCCRGPIRKGDPTIRHFSIFEGDCTSERMCAPCWFAREQFNEAHDFGSCCPSYFRTLLAECFVEDEAPQWGLIIVGMDARAVVFDALRQGATA